MNEIKEKLEHAERVAVLLPSDPSMESVLAAFAIKRSGGTKVVVVGGNKDMQKNWNDFYSDEKFDPKDFALSINTNDFPVEELRYEKQGDKLVVFFTTHTSITKDHFTLEEALPEAELVIALGFNTENDAREEMSNKMKLNGEEDFLLMDSREPAVAISSSIPLKLLARLLARSREEAALDTFWSFLPPIDFAKTGTQPVVIPPMMPSVSAIAGNPRFSAILWHGNNDEPVGGLIYSDDTAALRGLADKAGVSINSKHFILPDFPSFTEAEVEVRKLLKESL